jgi:hypothetical protein
MCIIETRFACGNVVRQRYFPTEACECEDVINEEHDIDEDCGYCTDCRVASHVDGAVRDLDWEDDEDGMGEESGTDFGAGDVEEEEEEDGEDNGEEGDEGQPERL